MGYKMEELREMLCEELDNMAGKEITTGSLEIIDKLTHSIKSIDTIMAMEEAGYSEEYSRRGSYRGGSYRDGAYDGSYEDGSYEEGGRSRRGSYARGRGRNARRDSRGRYSRRYSRAEDMMQEKLEDMMEETDDPKVKHALQKALTQMEE